MAMTRMLPVRATLRRPRLRWIDLVVGGAILVVLAGGAGRERACHSRGPGIRAL